MHVAKVSRAGVLLGILRVTSDQPQLSTIRQVGLGTALPVTSSTNRFYYI